MNRGPMSTSAVPAHRIRTVKLGKPAMPRYLSIRTILPPHGTDLTTIQAQCRTLTNKPTLVIFADNSKYCGVATETSRYEHGSVNLATLFQQNPGMVCLAFDHHNPVPASVIGKVGAEQVLNYRQDIAQAISLAQEHDFEIVIGSHADPYDPDAMISQWLIGEIAEGNISETNIDPIYEALANYAKKTDFYQFIFGPEQHLSLRGVCDGLTKLCQNSNNLVNLSNRILDWIKETGNKFVTQDKTFDEIAFKEFLAAIYEGTYHSSTIEYLLQQCMRNKKEAMETVRSLLENSPKRTISLIDKTGSPLQVQVILFDDPKAQNYGKEIDDVVYSQPGKPVILIKQLPNQQWWVCMRPTNYFTEEGKQQDPILRAENDPTFAFAPATAGYHEQVVALLPKTGNWTIWPYNGTAQQAEIGNLTGQEILNSLTN